uniref:Uncharacterized protein n=1 Tax=Spermophilus dauricus TaxID=99837 RepID=A0A8C9Q1D1_SPEDA
MRLTGKASGRLPSAVNALQLFQGHERNKVTPVLYSIVDPTVPIPTLQLHIGKHPSG